MIPHPSKAYRGGEDAFYASEKLLVVADGVGGWNTKGVDPSRYSRFLCSALVDFYEDHKCILTKILLSLVKILCS
jgi:protein phosphatase PTC7